MFRLKDVNKHWNETDENKIKRGKQLQLCCNYFGGEQTRIGIYKVTNEDQSNGVHKV